MEPTNSFSFSFLEKQTPYPEQATRLDILRKIVGDELLETKQNLSQSVITYKTSSSWLNYESATLACKLYRLDLDGDGQSSGVLSILQNQTFRNQWNHQERMERHCSSKTKFPIELKRSFRFDRNFDYCLAK